MLDPGHGRGDPGAVHYLPDGSGRYDLIEADSNLENAELVRDDLSAMGYTVYLTRNGAGQGPGAPLPLQFITSDLYARVALAKAVECAAVRRVPRQRLDATTTRAASRRGTAAST